MVSVINKFYQRWIWIIDNDTCDIILVGIISIRYGNRQKKFSVMIVFQYCNIVLKVIYIDWLKHENKVYSFNSFI